MFLDSVGNEINIGDKVRYVPDPNREDRGDGNWLADVWTAERYGLVMDTCWDKHSDSGTVMVFQYGTGEHEGRWPKDEFYCDANRLLVVAKARYITVECVKGLCGNCFADDCTCLCHPK